MINNMEDAYQYYDELRLRQIRLSDLPIKTN